MALDIGGLGLDGGSGRWLPPRKCILRVQIQSKLVAVLNGAPGSAQIPWVRCLIERLGKVPHDKGP